MVTVAEINERMLIAEVVRRLTRRYAQLPAEHISTAVHNAHARFTQSPFRRGPGAARGQSEIFDEGQVLVRHIRVYSRRSRALGGHPAVSIRAVLYPITSGAVQAISHICIRGRSSQSPTAPG